MIVTWIIIGALIILFFVGAFKAQDIVAIFSLIKKYFLLIISVALILFLCFSFYHIYKTYNLDLTSFDGVMQGGKLYLLWMKSIFGNFGKITGYAVSQNWVLDNSTQVDVKPEAKNETKTGPVAKGPQKIKK